MTTFVEEYRDVVDKSEWGDGPWNNEPDKAVWVDEATDLDCMINRGPMGSWCGYVGVGPEHPLYGRDYSECEHGSDCEDRYDHESPNALINVHGSLTFANKCMETDDPSKHVCHIPQPGRTADVWWFGFDCAHAWDLVPQMVASNRKYYEQAKAKGDVDGMRLWGYTEPDQVYRSAVYVESEVRNLASQLAALK